MVSKRCTTFAYADVTAIVVADKNVENGVAVMQHKLNTGAKWGHDNGLIINATKMSSQESQKWFLRDDNCSTNIKLLET